MVGKGVEAKSSRIFQQCYVKCCKLQNLTPLSNVLPSGNGRVLDFCVDRIKYADWPPILNAMSCDLSLHSTSIRCRQTVKTVLEQIDCERLAKTVNKRSVILTNFMLSNLIEALSQLLTSTTLLATLMLEGLPLKIPYLNPLCEAVLANNSLQHLYLPRCLIGDAGCVAVCKAVRCLPNILTLDLSGCEITPLGAGYITDLLKYQKIHRYSENWVHTLRYRLPELDAMAGLRRVSLCGNPALGDAGFSMLVEVLADDLWIKALDVANCGLTESSASLVLHTLKSNTTLVVVDLRHNSEISLESLSKVKSALKQNDRGGGQYSWLGSGYASDFRSSKSLCTKTVIREERRDRGPSMSRPLQKNYPTKTNLVKKEKDYAEVLEEQLQEEISHRQQLEELNLQLVDQMKQMKQQQIRLWANCGASSGSEHSLDASSHSGNWSNSSGSSSSIPIDQNTLSYIQQAFKDIYAFIKNNQCHGECLRTDEKIDQIRRPIVEEDLVEVDELSDGSPIRINLAKKAQSTHASLSENMKMKKITKSAHLLGEQNSRDSRDLDTKPEMFERQMGDSRNAHVGVEELIALKCKPIKHSSSTCSSVDSSSDTLVADVGAPREPSPRLNPREAFYSDSETDSDDGASPRHAY